MISGSNSYFDKCEGQFPQTQFTPPPPIFSLHSEAKFFTLDFWAGFTLIKIGGYQLWLKVNDRFFYNFTCAGFSSQGSMENVRGRKNSR